jgi:hypothetical protein
LSGIDIVVTPIRIRVGKVLNVLGTKMAGLVRFLESHFTVLSANCPAEIRDSYSARLIKLRDYSKGA